MKKIALLFSIVALASGICFAQTSGFTYQGKLGDGGVPANGDYQLECKLFDALADGTQVGSTLRISPVHVVNGVFTTQLDFGAAAFAASHGSQDRWLEVSVRLVGASTFAVLAPRQSVNSVPFAVRSQTADNATSLAGVTAGNYVQTSDARLSDARTPIAGSPDYIQNQNTTFQSGNFFITEGNAGTFNAITSFNIHGDRVLGVGVDFSDNLFLGIQAGEHITAGSENTFAGQSSGRSSTSGDFNSFFGSQAGITNDGGSGNTLIGFGADVATSNLLRATAIGWNAKVSQSDSLILGGFGVLSPFSIPYDTKVGIGITAPSFRLHVIDPSNAGLRVQTNTSGGTVASFGGLGAFQIDAAGVAGGRLQVAETGQISFGTLGAAGSTQLCRNASNQIASCSSSLRYKTNIAPFSNGLNFIDLLRPIAFTWKDGGMKDVGFGAEDVAQISPLLVTYNSTGQVEGVKYDRLSVLFVNAFKEQQTQIAEQRKLIEKQQDQIDLLKLALCHANPNEAVCKK